MWIKDQTDFYKKPTQLAEINKSALTDHANQENHTINWSKATLANREPDRLTRLINEATYIHKEGPRAMNRDEGSYQLNDR